MTNLLALFARSLVVAAYSLAWFVSWRHPCPLLESLVLSGFYFLVASAILAAIFAQGKTRAYWTGFAIFGFGYYFITFCVPPTTRYATERSEEFDSPRIEYKLTLDPERVLATSCLLDFLRASRALRVEMKDSVILFMYDKPIPAKGKPPKEETAVETLTPWQAAKNNWLMSERDPRSEEWHKYILIAISPEADAIEHGLLAIFFGWIGGAIARHFRGTRDREPTTAASVA